MADSNSGFDSAMSAIDQLVAQQQAAASASPTSAFGNVDPVMIGLAQGLLSPTKTGSFGESIGQGLAGIQGPLEAMRKQQLDARNKLQELQLARARLQMEAPYYQARADLASSRADQAGQLKTVDEVHLLTARNRYVQAQQMATTDVDKMRYQDLIDSIDNELRTRRGLSAVDTTRPAPPPEDKRTFLERILPEALGGKQAPTEEQPTTQPAKKEQPKKAEPSEDQTQTETKSQYYTGDKPPKDFPNAMKGNDGNWYVVKEGKTYPVLNQ